MITNLFGANLPEGQEWVLRLIFNPYESLFLERKERGLVASGEEGSSLVTELEALWMISQATRVQRLPSGYPRGVR